MQPEFVNHIVYALQSRQGAWGILTIILQTDTIPTALLLQLLTKTIIHKNPPHKNRLPHGSNLTILLFCNRLIQRQCRRNQKWGYKKAMAKLTHSDIPRYAPVFKAKRHLIQYHGNLFTTHYSFLNLDLNS